MQNDYAQLLLDVQKKSNITVNKSRDLRFLKEEIEENSELRYWLQYPSKTFWFFRKNRTKHQHTKYTRRLSRF